MEINECLRSQKKYWSKQELIERINERRDINIKERTFDEDLRRMRHCDQLKYYAPIKYCKLEDGYYYTDPNYSIDKLPLTPSDIEALEFATTTLKQYRQMSIFNTFTGTVDKLISLVNHVKNTDHTGHFEFIDFEKAPYVKGNEFLDEVIDAIKNKRVLRVVYQKFDDEVKEHIISPFLLKEYLNRWYMLGTHHKREKIITLAFDRFIDVEVNTEQGYIEKPEYNFKNTIGITYNEEFTPEKVILSFTAKQGNYIKTKYIHESQKILVDNEEECRISLDVTINFELISIILSHGDLVEVIEPKILRDKVSEIVSKCYNKYN